MKALLKYELKKTMLFKLVVTGALLVGQCLIFLGAAGFRSGMNKTIFGGILSAGVMGLGMGIPMGILISGVYSTYLLYDELNTPKGYMLFMTPNTGYQIIGAKILESLISEVYFGLLMVIFGLINIPIFMADEMPSMSALLAALSAHYGDIPSFLQLLTSVVIDILVGWLMIVATVILTTVLQSTIFNGKRGSGLICVVIWILLCWGLLLFERFLGSITGIYGGFLISIVEIILMLYISGYLLEHRKYGIT